MTEGRLLDVFTGIAALRDVHVQFAGDFGVQSEDLTSMQHGLADIGLSLSKMGHRDLATKVMVLAKRCGQMSQNANRIAMELTSSLERLQRLADAAQDDTLTIGVDELAAANAQDDEV